MKAKDMLPNYDFSNGVRGKYAKNYAKASFERPNLWYVVVTIIAMFYVSYFTFNVLVVAIYLPSLPMDQSLIAIIFSIGLALIWSFLIRDLIKQISLFFRKNVS